MIGLCDYNEKNINFGNMMSLFEGLNKPQLEATKFFAGAVLVLAGAGSGKTRVLTNRIAFLLERGISARHILAVTFTNKAAQEMKERIKSLAGEKADKVWISTFHSACLRMLRRDIPIMGISRDFHVFDTDDQLKVMKTILKQRDLSPQDHPPKRYISQFDDAKNKGGTLEDCIDYLYDKYGEDAAILFEEYQKTLRMSNALDFNDLIVTLIRLWKEHPEVLYSRQRQFQYVLIDEYQDTNPIQYELIRMLCQTQPQREGFIQRLRSDSENGDIKATQEESLQIVSQGLGNIMVVGDDDQSIYGFRGADVQNIFRFQDDFSLVHVIRLEQNYRSTGNILKAANSVISNNSSRMDKEMWTESEDGDLVSLLSSRTMWDEARDIQAEIEEIISGKITKSSFLDRYTYKDIAVIYRTNSYSLPFEQVFRRSATPHVLVGARKFYERSEVKDILAYLKILINPFDEVSFTRAISIPKRSIGPKTIEQIVVISRRDSISILDAALQWGKEGDSKIRTAVLHFCSLIFRLRSALYEGESVYNLLQDLLAESGYRAMLEDGIRKDLGEIRGERNIRVGVGKSDSERQLENINTLIDDILRFVQDFDEEKYIEDSLLEIEEMSSLLISMQDNTKQSDTNEERTSSEVFSPKPEPKTSKPKNSKQNLSTQNSSTEWQEFGPLFSLLQSESETSDSKQIIQESSPSQNSKPEPENSKPENNSQIESYVDETQRNSLWLRNFLDGAALASSMDDISEEEQSSVTLMTAHLAKGLEFPIVFVVGMNEGTFPHFRSLENEDDISEERRLVYVALTRAKRKLYVSYSQTSERWEGNSKREILIQPSRFLLEISNNCMDGTISLYTNYNNAERRSERSERLGIHRQNVGNESKNSSHNIGHQYAKIASQHQKKSSRSRNIASQNRKREQKQHVFPSTSQKNLQVEQPQKNISFVPLTGSYQTRTPSSFDDFQEGIRVFHEKFGHGMIVQKVGAKNNPKLVISFEHWGQRTLLARVANLDLVIPS